MYLLTEQQVISTAAIVLSLAFSFLPTLRDWYATLDSRVRSALMLALVVAVAAVYSLYACLPSSCVSGDIVGFVWTCIQAYVASQAAYLGAKPFVKQALPPVPLEIEKPATDYVGPV